MSQKTILKVLAGAMALSLIACSKGSDSNSASSNKLTPEQQAQLDQAAQVLKDKETVDASLIDVEAQKKSAEAVTADANQRAQAAQAIADQVKADHDATTADRTAAEKALADAQQELAMNKQALADLQQKSDTLNKQREALEKLTNTTSTSQDKLNAALAAGQTVACVIVVYGDSEEAINAAGMELAKIDVSKNMRSTSYKNKVDRWMGTFMVALNDAQGYINFSNYLKNQTMTQNALLITQGRIRSYVTVSYDDLKSKVLKSIARPPAYFWIGDSSDVAITPEFLSNKNLTLGSFTSDFKACKYVDSNCFDSIRLLNYLSQKTMIDNTLQDPIGFLKGQIWTTKEFYNSKDNNKVVQLGTAVHKDPLVSNITITHELWVQSSSDAVNQIKGNFTKEDGSQLVDVQGQGAYYPAPMKFQSSSISPEVLQDNAGKIWFMKDFYNHIVQTPTLAQ